MEVCHGAAVMEMVKVGLGVTLLPRWVVRMADAEATPSPETALAVHG